MGSVKTLLGNDGNCIDFILKMASEIDELNSR